ncbi:unnamed protein product [Lampetra planeri]
MGRPPPPRRPRVPGPPPAAAVPIGVRAEVAVEVGADPPGAVVALVTGHTPGHVLGAPGSVHRRLQLTETFPAGSHHAAKGGRCVRRGHAVVGRAWAVAGVTGPAIVGVGVKGSGGGGGGVVAGAVVVAAALVDAVVEVAVVVAAVVVVGGGGGAAVGFVVSVAEDTVEVVVVVGVVGGDVEVVGSGVVLAREVTTATAAAAAVGPPGVAGSCGEGRSPGLASCIGAPVSSQSTLVHVLHARGTS